MGSGGLPRCSLAGSLGLTRSRDPSSLLSNWPQPDTSNPDKRYTRKSAGADADPRGSLRLCVPRTMAGCQLPSLLLPTTHEQAMNASGHRQPRLIRLLVTSYHPDTSSFPRPNPAPRPLPSLTDLGVFSYFRSAKAVAAPQVHPSDTQSPASSSTAAWSSAASSPTSLESSSVPPPGGTLKTSIY